MSEPRHGYDVVEWIRSVTNDTLQIDDGALYTSASSHGEARLARSGMAGVAEGQARELTTA